MTDSAQLVIQGDQEAIAKIEEAINAPPDSDVLVSPVKQQFGDPNLWTLAGTIITAALTRLGPVLLELIKQKRIGYIKYGDIEIKDVTVDDFQTFMEKDSKKETRQ